MFSLPLPSSGAQLTLCWAKSVFWPHRVPKHFLLAYPVLCLATSFKVSVSVPSAQPASSSSSQICSRESLLLWLWLPGCSFDARAKTEAIPPSASQPLLLPCRAHNCVSVCLCCSHRANRSRDGLSRCQGCTKQPHWAAGRGRAQPGWAQSCLNQLKVALLGCSHSSQQFSHPRLERLSAQVLDLKVRGVH